LPLLLGELTAQGKHRAEQLVRVDSRSSLVFNLYVPGRHAFLPSAFLDKRLSFPIKGGYCSSAKGFLRRVRRPKLSLLITGVD
jgi:hypothetical protein